jgi:uncharacterized DUF497 family protein
MERIHFSKHSIEKIKILKKHGVDVNKQMIKNIIHKPEKVDKGYKGRKVAQGEMDERHVLRIVYEEIKNNEILVLTLYPGRKERYEKD